MVDLTTYLKNLTRCIENRDVRSEIRQEFLDHIEDQKEAYMESGMSEEEAEREAVRQMGEPEEVGMELNRIHRPKLDWKTGLSIIVFGLLGQYCIWLLTLGYDRIEIAEFALIPGFTVWRFGIFFLAYGIFWSILEKIDDLPFFYGVSQSGGSNMNSSVLCAIGITGLSTRLNFFILLLIVLMIMLGERYYIDNLRNHKEQRYLFSEGMAKTDIDYKGKAQIGDKLLKVRIRKHAIKAGTPIVVVGIEGFMLVVEPLI